VRGHADVRKGVENMGKEIGLWHSDGRKFPHISRRRVPLLGTSCAGVASYAKRSFCEIVSGNWNCGRRLCLGSA
jgi:hypothetical protein